LAASQRRKKKKKGQKGGVTLGGEVKGENWHSVPRGKSKNLVVGWLKGPQCGAPLQQAVTIGAYG